MVDITRISHMIHMCTAGTTWRCTNRIHKTWGPRHDPCQNNPAIDKSEHLSCSFHTCAISGLIHHSVCMVRFWTPDTLTCQRTCQRSDLLKYRLDTSDTLDTLKSKTLLYKEITYTVRFWTPDTLTCQRTCQRSDLLKYRLDTSDTLDTLKSKTLLYKEITYTESCYISHVSHMHTSSFQDHSHEHEQAYISVMHTKWHVTTMNKLSHTYDHVPTCIYPHHVRISRT